MGDVAYTIIRGMGYPIFCITSRRRVLHGDRVRRPGAFILAANHLSPYDVPALMGFMPRKIDFLSTIEMLRNPVVAWLFRRMNCEFVDRKRPDSSTARALARRLERGRIVAMFPESGIRREEESVIHGGRFKPGVVRLAQIAGVPIVPCVIVGTAAYRKFKSWLPLRRTPLGINFGMPIEVPRGLDPQAAQAQAIERLRQSYRDLYQELEQSAEAQDTALHRAKTETSTPQTPALR